MSKRVYKRMKIEMHSDPGLVLDFSRYRKNPVILKEHNWAEAPIGFAKDIKYDGKEWSIRSTFHGETPESLNIISALIAKTQLKLYPGGQVERDKDGNITRFHLYEISIAP